MAFLAEIARVVDPALDECFPPGSGVTLRAGPGRCYMASAFMLAEKKKNRIKGTNRLGEEKHSKQREEKKEGSST